MDMQYLLVNQQAISGDQYLFQHLNMTEISLIYIIKFPSEIGNFIKCFHFAKLRFHISSVSTLQN